MSGGERLQDGKPAHDKQDDQKDSEPSLFAQQVGEHEPDKEHLYRRKTVGQQDLGTHEARAPEDYGGNGQYVPDGGAVFHREKCRKSKQFL